MEDLKSLERFLRTEEEKSHRSQLGTYYCIRYILIIHVIICSLLCALYIYTFAFIVIFFGRESGVSVSKP